VRELAAGPGVILLCGQFEGFDERIFEGRGVEEVSVGDIVLSGGEPAALMLLDACIRLLPGVMGAASSGTESRSRTASLSIRTIPGPPFGKGARSLKCCDRGIMRKSPHGGNAGLRTIPGHAGRTFGAHIGARSSLPLARSMKCRTNEMNIIQQLEAEAIAEFKAKKTIPEFRAGDTVRVGACVVEGERARVQAYEGVCIARSNRGLGSNFTVRKMSFGEGVERVFRSLAQHDGVAVVRRGVVRRAKLYYLRGRTRQIGTYCRARGEPHNHRGKLIQGRALV